METNRNEQVVSRLYDAWAHGDTDGSIAPFDEAIAWFPAEGHPYAPEGKPWVGLADLTENFFKKVSQDWEQFVTKPDRFHAAGDTVIVEGRYNGTFKPRQRHYDAQFCHIWTLNSAAKIVCLRQYSDTAQMQRVMGR